MSVSRRLVFSVGILLLLALGALGSQVWIASRMQHIMENVSGPSLLATRTLLDMEQITWDLRQYSGKLLAFTDADTRNRYDEKLSGSIQEFEQRFKELVNLLGPRDAPEEIALLSTAWIDYKTQLETARHLPATKALDQLPPDLDDAIRLLEERTESSRGAVMQSVALQARRNASMAKQAEQISYAGATLFVLLGGIVTFLTLRAINSPLRHLTRGTRKLASGEFSHRLPETGPSEFAELARDFNAMSKKLEELDEMKKEFVAHVSHELKAPLAAIRQTLAVTLEQVPGPINDGQRRLLQLSRTSAERLSAMVSNLLDVSRLEAGTMEYEMAPQDIVRIVQQTVEEFSLKAGEQQTEILVESNLPAIPVICDGDRMIQVVGNLLDNALKFSPQNSTIVVRLVHNDSTVRVAIADRGTGVPDAHKQKVFLKFHQLNARGKRTAGQGVGLGLAICKTIVDAHRGRIWVEDNPEGGSVFCVELRAAPVKETAKCG